MIAKTTPLMMQYHAIKADYPEALVFFQVGDFYELFFEDAKKASAFLGITLTKRGKDAGQDIPLCGVPVHTVQHYLAKLVKGGFSVVICDQLEAPKPGTIVKRGVTQVLTPGTLTDSTLLDEKSASYIFAFIPGQDEWGFLFAELLTAQLYGTTCKAGQYKILETELGRFFPDEILLMQGQTGSFDQALFKKQGYYTTQVAVDEENRSFIEQFEKKVIDVVNAHQSLRSAVNLFTSYMHKNYPTSLATFSQLHMYEPEDFLLLDQATQRNLEMLCNAYDGTRAHSLLDVLDRTCTHTGSRTLKKWLLRPLLDPSALAHRHDVVQFLYTRFVLLSDVRFLLQQVGDIERVVGRIALERATLADYRHLQRAFEIFARLQSVLPVDIPPLLTYVKEACNGFSELHTLLSKALYAESHYDWIIASGYDEHLDALRDLMLNSQQALLDLEQEEQKKTGISSLKIRYNNLYGYYIEVTKANIHLVPDRYTQRHSLVGKERFMSVELQDLERRITSAQADAHEQEQLLFKQVVDQVRGYVGRLRKAATLLGYCDVLASFAYSAHHYGYVRPSMDSSSRDIIIEEGRHPVIEQLLGSSFIPNGTMLTDEKQLWIITGPNMGGKSTYLRQVALISIMAQSGSFVPAKKAHLPFLDRIFTRIGASDNVAAGKSTFLVEMEETADICRYATERSLVILDEVGRGTSTQDGVALAQAIVEYLYSTVRARCLFATHYHELTDLQNAYAGIVCYYTGSKQTEQGIVFLHTLCEGVSHKSFGLEVATIAALPESILSRARELVLAEQLKPGSHTVASAHTCDNHLIADQVQHLIKENEHLRLTIKAVEELKAIDLNELTPKRAFDLVWNIRQHIE